MDVCKREQSIIDRKVVFGLSLGRISSWLLLLYFKIPTSGILYYHMMSSASESSEQDSIGSINPAICNSPKQ